MAESIPRLISTHEALKYAERSLGKRPHPSTIHRWYSKGKITGERRGDRVLLHAESLEAFLLPRPLERPHSRPALDPDGRRGEAAATRIRFAPEPRGGAA